MLLNKPYNNKNGAATIVATPIPIRPRKNITTISPTENIVTNIPSSKSNGIISNPIAANANNINHNLSKPHLSFQ